MQSVYISGRKKGDRLILSMSPYIRAQLAKRPDGPIEAHIEWREPTRRARVNRFYFGVVLKMIAEEMGESVEYVHELSPACSMRPLAIVATKKGVTCRRCLQMIGKSR